MDESIFFKDVVININEVDARNRLKLNCLINHMQEAAWHNAGALGYSTYDLLKLDITWAMNRIKIQINSLPGHLDEVSVETWPSGMDKYFCYRDYRLWNDKKELLAKATSTWVVLDIVNRKMIAVPEDIANAGFNQDRGNMDKVRSKIRYKDQKTQQELPHTVSWFDLDINEHVNNSNYIKWYMDALPSDVVEQSHPVEVDVAFLSEGYAKDELQIQTYKELDGGYVQRVYSRTKEKALSTAQIRFNNF